MSDKAKRPKVWMTGYVPDINGGFEEGDKLTVNGEPVTLDGLLTYVHDAAPVTPMFFDNVHPDPFAVAVIGNLPAMRELEALAARNDAWSNAARAERGHAIGDSWIDCFGDHREG